MKKLLTLVVVVAAVAFAVKYGSERFLKASGEKKAASRVSAFCQALRTNDEQTAMSMWAMGQLTMSEEELRAAIDHYADFLREKGITRVGSCTPGAVEVGSDGIHVGLTIDGKQLRVRVPESGPFQWD